MSVHTDKLFAPGSPLLVADGIIECPAPDCGAPCNSSDVFDDGTCRYCGQIIELPQMRVDGIELTVGDRVLVKGRLGFFRRLLRKLFWRWMKPEESGVYVVTRGSWTKR